MSPSPAFIRRGRNPSLPAPHKVERTEKKEGDHEIVNPAITAWRAIPSGRAGRASPQAGARLGHTATITIAKEFR